MTPVKTYRIFVWQGLAVEICTKQTQIYRAYKKKKKKTDQQTQIAICSGETLIFATATGPTSEGEERHLTEGIEPWFSWFVSGLFEIIHV